jgi:hypothetical protein
MRGQYKLNLEHVVWKGVDCIFLTQDTNQWRVHAHTINKLQIQYNEEDFLSTKWKTVVFSINFLPLRASHRKSGTNKTHLNKTSEQQIWYVRWSMYCLGRGFRPLHRNKEQDVGSHCRLKSLLKPELSFHESPLLYSFSFFHFSPSFFCPGLTVTTSVLG